MGVPYNNREEANSKIKLHMYIINDIDVMLIVVICVSDDIMGFLFPRDIYIYIYIYILYDLHFHKIQIDIEFISS